MTWETPQMNSLRRSTSDDVETQAQNHSPSQTEPWPWLTLRLISERVRELSTELQDTNARLRSLRSNESSR
jgi:hypothetical protein